MFDWLWYGWNKDSEMIYPGVLSTSCYDTTKHQQYFQYRQIWQQQKKPDVLVIFSSHGSGRVSCSAVRRNPACPLETRAAFRIDHEITRHLPQAPPLTFHPRSEGFPWRLGIEMGLRQSCPQWLELGRRLNIQLQWFATFSLFFSIPLSASVVDAILRDTDGDNVFVNYISVGSFLTYFCSKLN